ncbi:UNVERIFIED_CONTAM: hypothetical protein FKN15_052153 [Acipenser sinensis]
MQQEMLSLVMGVLKMARQQWLQQTELAQLARQVIHLFWCLDHDLCLDAWLVLLQESATANAQVIAEKDMLPVQAIHTWQTKKPAYHQCGRQILKARALQGVKNVHGFVPK